MSVSAFVTVLSRNSRFSSDITDLLAVVIQFYAHYLLTCCFFYFIWELFARRMCVVRIFTRSVVLIYISIFKVGSINSKTCAKACSVECLEGYLTLDQLQRAWVFQTHVDPQGILDNLSRER